LSQTQINKIGCQQIIDITDKLPVNKNYTWQQLTGGPRDIAAITTIALHHDCYPKKNVANTSDMDLAISIAIDHIALTKNEPKGDAGFPYHIWIRNGQAYQTNDLLSFTYGVGSNNGYTVHICVSGEYKNTDVLTDADRKALYGAIVAVIGILPNYKEIKGHCELNSTDCPGYDHMRVKADISTLQMALIQHDTWAAKITKIGEIVNEINFCNDLIKKGEADGAAQWAMNKQLELRDLMIQTGLLNKPNA
jgi:hypothetical protein